MNSESVMPVYYLNNKLIHSLNYTLSIEINLEATEAEIEVLAA